jgi:hypothetical protein
MNDGIWITLWRALEEWGKRAWVAVLLVSMISLFFGILTYCSQRASNRPELAYGGGGISWDQNPVKALFSFAGTGRKTVRRGTATLFAVVSDGSGNHVKERLGAAPIIGSGANVMPGFGGSADMSLTVTTKPEKFLLCTMYFDEVGEQYQQSFLLQMDHEKSSARNSTLNETAPFGSSLCNTAFRARAALRSIRPSLALGLGVDQSKLVLLRVADGGL